MSSVPPRTVVESLSAFAATHDLIVVADEGSPWVGVERADDDLPTQGWKLHVSASSRNAAEVLVAVLPVLGEHRCTFKVARDRHELLRLNDGSYGASQIGKFVTVYPADETTALALGRDLAAATRGVSAPRIPSDRRLRPDAPVYYRYGAFRGRVRQDVLGEVEDVLERPDGTLVPDRRRRYASVPDWVVDPFETAGLRVAPPPASLTVAGRYLLAKSLSPTAVVTIFLAVDTAKGRRTVLKRLPLETGTDRTPDQVVGVLEREARLMRELEQLRLFPWAADVFVEGEHAFLPMEHLDGEPLPDWIARRFAEHGRCPVDEVEALLAAVSRALAAVHARGYVYADLKSEHVIVDDDLSIRLLDAETLLHEDDAFDEPMRTPGYASPQQWAGERPVPADDVHAFGALVYELLTGTVAHDAPRPHRLLDQPIRALAPGAPQHLVDLAEACLSVDRSARPTADQLAELIVRRHTCASPRSADATPGDADTAWRSTIDRLLDEVHAHDGRAWWTFPDDVGPVNPFLGNGVAGVAYALCELAPLADPAQARRIDALLPLVATWLDEQRPLRAVPLGGLYVGESGIGVALTVIGTRVDAAWIATGLDRIRRTSEHELASPDLFNGIAGRLRAHLLAWRTSGERRDLDDAVAAAHRLLATATHQCGATRWPYPAGHGELSDRQHHGYAHGSAGIADALLDLLAVLSADAESGTDVELQVRLRRAVEGAVRGLAAAARPRPARDGLVWTLHHDAAATDLSEPYWCHGATGIARFLIRAHRADRHGLLTLDVDVEPIIRGAVVAIAERTQLGASQCHGLAGSVELLVDAADALDTVDHPAIGAEAQRLASLLPAFLGPRDDELDPSWNPSMMTGAAGTARAAARAARPTALPALLSPFDDLLRVTAAQSSPR
ncbi:MAG: lanthionine synthetase LanC family protein [Acidimicrobiales bacterium]